MHFQLSQHSYEVQRRAFEALSLYVLTFQKSSASSIVSVKLNSVRCPEIYSTKKHNSTCSDSNCVILATLDHQIVFHSEHRSSPECSTYWDYILFESYITSWTKALSIWMKRTKRIILYLQVDCETIKKWLIKNSAESENLTWIIANTKPCPKCKRAIEKNQGCMHMTCSQCKHQFCWLCLADWKTHGEGTGGFYSCNRSDFFHKLDPMPILHLFFVNMRFAFWWSSHSVLFYTFFNSVLFCSILVYSVLFCSIMLCCVKHLYSNLSWIHDCFTCIAEHILVLRQQTFTLNIETHRSRDKLAWDLCRLLDFS